ncbi:MAG: His/Gly/Thr/Pro-type tRNA ligase C-terminal domain-containing protein, partial [Candidatus Omnitrophota bacterium]
IKDQLFSEGFRVAFDDSAETLQKKIRNAEIEKLPYILVVGTKEAQNNCVAVRKRRVGDQGQVGLEEFVKRVREEIEEKR